MITEQKSLIQQRFDKSFESYHHAAIVQRQIATRLSCLISNTTKPEFGQVLEIGCGTGFLTQQLFRNHSFRQYYLNDLSKTAIEQLLKHQAHIPSNVLRYIVGNAELLDLPLGLDAIFSASTFQWFGNLKQFIQTNSPKIKPGGILAFSTFGEKNYQEIKTTLQVGLKYKTLSEISSYLQEDFEIIHREEWLQKENFKTPYEILKHMKRTGVNSLINQPFTKGALRKFACDYTTLFTTKQKMVSLSYHPILFIAKKK